jgi:uncharacterized protein (DUF488 family)
MNVDRMTIFTIGHSNRPVDELRDILAANGVTQLIDIRRFPRSASNPQFDTEPLRAALAASASRRSIPPGTPAGR